MKPDLAFVLSDITEWDYHADRGSMKHRIGRAMLEAHGHYTFTQDGLKISVTLR